ncbi:MAG: ankyrin repeat domain-containing protein [Ramlibacter sp.]|nr:ankyrin repeat domain-containing protein [Ramlibacter sp.]
MPDHDPMPDPIDKAYAQAEALLHDEDARTARRARILAAVAQTAEGPPPDPRVRASVRRLSWGRGGWLAAASVAGLSALIAVRLHTPAVIRQPPPASASAAPQAASAVALDRDAAARAPAEIVAPTSPAVPASSGSDASRHAPAAEPAPSFEPAPARAEAEAAADSAADFTETRSRAASPSAAARAPSAAKAAPAPALPVSAGSMATRLQDAAAEGRVAELSRLLAEGARVDAPDNDGETALMKAVQANQPAAAALLRRRGADLDLENDAGASARDMAAAIDEPELNRALGLAP